jgi:hypothetical protein
MMNVLTPFDRLIATEAAVRLEFVYRCQVVMVDEDGLAREVSVADPDRGQSRDEVADRLADSFIRIYDYAFQDSSQHHKVVGGRVCNSRDLTAQDLSKLREIFRQFTKKNYDEQGRLVLDPKEGPEALRDLYERLRDEVPLLNSDLACGALFVEMGLGVKWLRLFPRGIDFTRGEPILEKDPARFLEARFREALFGAEHSPSSSPFIEPPESKVEIAGLRFAAKTIQQWRTHLITQTGHLVDLTAELRLKIERHVASGKPLDDLRVEVREAKSLGDWLDVGGQDQAAHDQVREKVKLLSGSPWVDGMKAVDEQGGARLMCLDVDFLTGLGLKPLGGQSEGDLALFKNLMKEVLGSDNFADWVPAYTAPRRGKAAGEVREWLREELKTCLRRKIEKLSRAAQERGEPRLESLVDIAGTHLEAMLPLVDEAADKALARAEAPEGEKRLYMTMGGSASGKSGLKRLADSECGPSLVVASLDDARGECARYWIYPATNNHNDDYQAAEQFGNAVRDLIARRALEAGFHLYLDGSGIPYEGRNDKITRAFREKGFHVSVLAAQAPLFVHDPKRREELGRQGIAPDDALSRLGARQAKELRGLNPKIVVDKHIKFPLASRNAARDSRVDRFMIQDATDTENKYTLSYVLILTREETERLAKLRGGELKRALVESRLVPLWVKLPGGQEEHFNLKVIRANEDGQTYRVEIITDIEQYICMVEKGLLTRNASGPEALYNYNVHADLEGHFHGPQGKLKTLGAKGVGERALDSYRPFA